MFRHLLSKLPAPRMADWRCGRMSVCIAVLCEERKTLVCVSDNKVNFGTFSAETVAMKDIPIYKRCTALVAGNDTEHANPILERAHQLLYSNNKVKSPSEIADIVDQAFAERVNREIEAKVLRKRGFTVESFLEKGKQKCTPSAYLALCNRIDQVSISLRFLICGFDEQGIGHIYSVDGKTAPSNYDSVGFWAIGSGAHAALSSLAFHANQADVSVFRPKEEAVYFALTAKFMAESSDEVGKLGALVSVFDASPEHEIEYMRLEAITQVRALWQVEGAPRVPKNISEFVGPLLAPLKQDE
jgi:hypothetical protein